MYVLRPYVSMCHSLPPLHILYMPCFVSVMNLRGSLHVKKPFPMSNIYLPLYMLLPCQILINSLFLRQRLVLQVSVTFFAIVLVISLTDYVLMRLVISLTKKNSCWLKFIGQFWSAVLAKLETS
ncbi:hypothetical protein O6H91_16G022500 [Diphasiastrum complanatum]|uniref:Uncharacterized protein n=1 Tax=Diphasiastrum complanatum TaxID=34168 RepID=A0ACC2BAK2_DIPCM|nr:hypothetical protein O6H91_16G022500 [Diphasiastrum complanatum]